MIGTDGYMWAFNKPAGLPTHPGTGHEDSLSSRLAAYFADAPFKPVPVHRLDKETSGVLLVAASYEALSTAQDALLTVRHNNKNAGASAPRHPSTNCQRWESTVNSTAS